MNSEAHTRGKTPADAMTMLGHNSRMALDWVAGWQALAGQEGSSALFAKGAREGREHHRPFGCAVAVPDLFDGCVIAHFLIVVAARKLGIDQVPPVTPSLEGSMPFGSGSTFVHQN